jgi:hypothetical protein
MRPGGPGRWLSTYPSLNANEAPMPAPDAAGQPRGEKLCPQGATAGRLDKANVLTAYLGRGRQLTRNVGEPILSPVADPHSGHQGLTTLSEILTCSRNRLRAVASVRVTKL